VISVYAACPASCEARCRASQLTRSTGLIKAHGRNCTVGASESSPRSIPPRSPSQTDKSGIVNEFTTHYNRGRPHSALGPGIPEPPQAKAQVGPHRHKLPSGYRVSSTPVLGGLHHEYRLEKEAA